MNQKSLGSKIKTGAIVLASVAWMGMGYLTYTAHQYNVENTELKNTIDTQQEMLYNTSKQLDSMEKDMSVLSERLKEDDEALKSKSMWFPVQMELTFYTISADECGNDAGITASGRPAQVGRTIACNSLPIGTKVMIEGNVYTVEDTGGMPDNTLDVLVGTKAEAYARGRYTTTVYILK